MLLCAPAPVSSGEIPSVAWSRAIGAPFQGALKSTGLDDGYYQGLPIGGLGAGSIGRTYRGDFARWHLDVGQHYYRTAPANQFSVFLQPEGGVATARVLSVWKPDEGTLAAWGWDTTVRAGNRYHALFPKAWYVYRDLGQPVELVCEQFSPFFPHNYKEPSFPLGIFRWTAVNRSSKPITVSLLFTWENMLGWFANAAPQPDPFDDGPPYAMRWGASEGNRNAFRNEGAMRGLVLSRGQGLVSEEWDGEFVLATEAAPGVEVSYLARFNATGSGAEVWQPFSAAGRLPNRDDARPAARGERIAAALAVRFTLAPGASRTVPIVLAWDLPIMEFAPGVKWYKRYTAFFGHTGHNALAIAREGLRNHARWSEQIDAWMQPYLEDRRTPAWFKTALFNELYYLLDSGMAWENGRPMTKGMYNVYAAPPRTNYPPLGRFAYLECYEYRFYSTLDVNAYGSFAVLMLFPELDKQEAKLFADAVASEDSSTHPIGWTKEWKPRKLRGAVPMDLGVPFESPWLRTSFYTWQDPNTLKDESSNLALKVWRDYVFTGKKDIAFLKHTWRPLRETHAYMQQFDHDGDGIPEDDGVPDQTYDSWTMTGTGAYIGSLWIAGLEAMAAIARELGEQGAAREYGEWAARARKSFEAKLWNGEYYDFDTGSADRKAIMADQLFGQFYAQMTGLPDVVPAERRNRALRKVFEYNVMKYYDGEAGAVNGMMPDGTVDRIFTQQSNSYEVWTGVTYALAAFLLDSGMEREAWQTARGPYRITYETGGMWFRTPEGWTDQPEPRPGEKAPAPGPLQFRASMYMRPLAIWAIQAVLDGKSKRLLEKK